MAQIVPDPAVSDGSVLIKAVNSCISAGTEISAIKSSGKSLITKALEQPERVAKLLNIIRSEGAFKAYEKIKEKSEVVNPLGYSMSGIVVATGKNVKEFKAGDYVAAAGGSLANHAEFVDVPINLVVKMPKKLGFVDSSTVALGAIAMQGIRRIDLNIGEFCVVVGAGIIGMLAIQVLLNAGIRVAVIDIDERRLEIAEKLGAEVSINPAIADPVLYVHNWTGAYGADGVLFTAATSDSKPLSDSFKMCRKKGRVVLVGVSGMNLRREDLYSKELDLMISTSYGPGRYDPQYEREGCEYPYAYIRWTEKRNMEEYLRLLSQRTVILDFLKEAVFPIEEVASAFDKLQEIPKPLMVFLDYGLEDFKDKTELTIQRSKVYCDTYIKPKEKIIKTAVIGVGNFSRGTVLPIITRMNNKFEIYAIAAKTGYKIKHVAEKYGAKYATTNLDDILADRDVDLIVIATRHNTHAGIVLSALEAGKNVFVEKPPAINQEELDAIKAFYNNKSLPVKPLLMVGYNRRFSPYAQIAKKYTRKRINPMFIIYRMNAGYIPKEHWVHGKEGGGRIIGEVCHIIDLFTFLTESNIATISFDSISPITDKFSDCDNKAIILKYKDGSVCVLSYFSVGNRDYPKENMEIHFDEKTLIIDNYKQFKSYGLNTENLITKTPEKGHKEEWLKLFSVLTGKDKEWPIELWDLVQTSEATFAIK